ncbi:g8492 [Coccomyxa elongata]
MLLAVAIWIQGTYLIRQEACGFTAATMTITTSTIGFPRIGEKREVKKALETYWKKATSLEELLAVNNEAQRLAWTLQADAGVALVGLDGTLYDQVLDFIFYLGLAPPRFSHLSGYDLYFALARGVPGTEALDMSKFFDTNYHYLVPELATTVTPKPDFSLLYDKVKRGQDAIGKEKAVPIVIGPNTLVGLSKPADASAPFDHDSAIKALLPAYTELLTQLKALGVPEVQMHEPILTTSDAAKLKAEFESSYSELSKVGVPLNLVTYYDDIGEAYEWAVKLPVAAVSLDFLGVPGSALGNETAALVEKYGFPNDKRLGAGVVDGRSVFADGETPTNLVAALLKKGIDNISVQSSTSLQHLPYNKDLETELPADLVARLAFAKQKVAEIVEAASKAPSASAPASLTAALPTVNDPKEAIAENLFNRSEDFKARRAKQIQTPDFPTTTIGSFPQTPELRRARLQFKKGQLSAEDYEKVINDYMKYANDEQERIGLDVFVHGEPERTDMVEYFGVKLEGFAFTEAGWVQSYGSRYVRPPIIYGDVSRTGPITVKEFKYAQSLTQKPVKGMLTGPVTILNWSFPRKDISRSAQAYQLALALREEVADLEAAGCKVIQVDEPALREGLPLKRARWESYLSWAVRAFRLSTVVAGPATQIVTHLCYSEFADILPAIDGLDADVLTIENSRSGDEMLRCLAKYGYSRDIGAGVYDVHSPVVPPVDFIEGKIKTFLDVNLLSGNRKLLWVNPDCGLKTREWAQVLPSLENMVNAAKNLRAQTA